MSDGDERIDADLAFADEMMTKGDATAKKALCEAQDIFRSPDNIGLLSGLRTEIDRHDSGYSRTQRRSATPDKI